MVKTTFTQEKHVKFYTDINKPDEYLFLNFNEILNGFKSVSQIPVEDYLSQSFDETLLKSLSDDKEYFIKLKEILKFLATEEINLSSNYFNYNGLCQMHYYFTIISLHGSVCYTLACLMDRFFKFEVI